MTGVQTCALPIWFVRNYVLYDGDFLGLRTQEECAQRYAMELFKPTGRRNGMNMGISIKDMLFRSDWALLVFKSFVGILAPLTRAHRAWIFAGYGLMFLAGATGILRECIRGINRRLGVKNREGAEERVPVDVSRLMLHLGLVTAVLLPNIMNIWYSYSNDYQPQGRYSMPMLVPFMYYVTRGIGYWGRRISAGWRNRGAQIMKLSGYLVCLWMVAVLGYCTVRIMWPAYRNVENKAEVRVYTLEELFGEKK